MLMAPVSKAKSIWMLASSLGLSYFAAALGSLGSISGIQTWFETLNKPWFTPPNWVFGPAWAVLYTFIGIAAWRVWIAQGVRPLTTSIYLIQLALNAVWSPIFFGLEKPLGALLILIALDGVAALCLWQFAKADRIAGYWFLPYLLWLGFATALNLAIVILN